MRWTYALLLDAARAGARRPPGGAQEFRVGGSGGGFDRLAFALRADRRRMAARRAKRPGWPIPRASISACRSTAGAMAARS